MLGLDVFGGSLSLVLAHARNIEPALSWSSPQTNRKMEAINKKKPSVFEVVQPGARVTPGQNKKANWKPLDTFS